jgi:hypothetical protein
MKKLFTIISVCLITYSLIAQPHITEKHQHSGEPCIEKTSASKKINNSFTLPFSLTGKLIQNHYSHRDHILYRTTFRINRNEVLQHLRTSTIKQKLDSALGIVDGIPYKYFYDYDSNGNCLSETGYEWNDNSGQWEYYDKTEWAYDTNDNLIQSVVYVGFQNQWYTDYKDEFTYDSFNNKISDVWFVFWGMQWDTIGKYEFTYNVNMQLVSLTTYLWDINQIFEPYYKSEFTYNANSQMSEVLFYDWDTALNQWELTGKFEFSYTINNLTNMTNFSWYQISGTWVFISKADYYYDTNNNLISEESSQWSGNQWIYSNKTEYTNDASGNVTQKNIFFFDMGQWINSIKEEFVVNSAYPLSELHVPVWYFEGYLGDGLFWTAMVTNWKYSYWNNNQWNPGHEYDFYFSDLITFINEKELPFHKIYPNPATDKITITDHKKSGLIEIIDVNGKLIKEQYLPENKAEIDISQFPQGIYFLRMDNSIHKIIKN